MAELKYTPVRHNHDQFLAKARERKGFNEAYEALELEYQLVNQLLKARARASAFGTKPSASIAAST